MEMLVPQIGSESVRPMCVDGENDFGRKHDTITGPGIVEVVVIPVNASMYIMVVGAGTIDLHPWMPWIPVNYS